MNHSKHATPEAGTASVYSLYTARRRPLFCNCLLGNSLRIRAWTNTMESHRSDEIHGEWCCTCGISAPLFRFAEVHCSTVCWSVPFWTHETFQVYHGLVVVFRIHLDSIPYLPAVQQIISSRVFPLYFYFCCLPKQMCQYKRNQKKIGSFLWLYWHLKFESYPMTFFQFSMWPESVPTHPQPDYLGEGFFRRFPSENYTLFWGVSH